MIDASQNPAGGLLRKIDAVTVPVPSLDQGLRFYRDEIGHELLWRNDDLGQAGIRMPDADTEIVLTTRQTLQVNWLVASAPDAVRVVVEAGGQMLSEPSDIPVGVVAVVSDPFGNTLVLIDLSKGRYETGPDGSIIGLR